MKKYKFAILKNEDPFSHREWEKSCIKYGCDYEIIDLTSNNWFEQITENNFDCLLLKPPGRVAYFKDMYDEKVYLLTNTLKMFTYPSLVEVSLHENKKKTAYWLDASGLPHIPTKVFFNIKNAYNYVKTAEYPIVAKTAVGGSGLGVKFLYDENSASRYIKKAFGKGIRRKTGPDFRQGNIAGRMKKWLKYPSEAIYRIQGYMTDLREYQKGFVIFQTYIKHDFEWRVVRIGESYFAHKKTKVGEMCSGSKGIEYVDPPLSLLEFAKQVCDFGKFNSMAIDILEGENGEYLINELQTIFGHVQDYILEVNGKPGRYLHRGGEWIFQEGSFNSNLSFDLRLENVIEILKKEQRLKEIKQIL